MMSASSELVVVHSITHSRLADSQDPPPLSSRTTEPLQIEGASYYVGAAVALLAWMTARRTFSVYGALDRFPPSARAQR